MKTKNRIWIYPLIVVGLLLILTNSCKKDEDNNNPSSITDKDGNVYTSVTIGTQVWMKENLKTTKYNNGTTIPNVTDDTEWENLNTGAYCWYDNEITNKASYGALYNWYAVNTGKLCPAGWHVPTDAEWTILIDYLGGKYFACGKLKETGTTHWGSPNAGATNETGFTALPGGYRLVDGYFLWMGYTGHYWSSTEGAPCCAWNRILFRDYDQVDINNYYKPAGNSVRCLKN